MIVGLIIQKYLEENHYDGLYNSVTHCACEIDCVMPCEKNAIDCEPGFLRECDDPNYEFCIGEK